jgi:hypothetical protein
MQNLPSHIVQIVNLLAWTIENCKSMMNQISIHHLVAACAFAIVSLLAAVPLFAASDVSVPRFGLFEVSFRCPDMTGNPFDPAANDVWATLTGPHGQLRIPAFWDGNGVWKARVTPETLGAYSMRLSRNGADETVNAITPTKFISVASGSPGFVRVSGATSSWHHFVFDSGATYYPIGMDAAWGGNDVMDYPQLFPKMAASGMNWARVWMNAWDGKALDWGRSRQESPQPGTALLLDSARRVDSVLMSAQSSGIYVQLTLQHHGQVTKVVDPNWNENPMNAANPGGFLAAPQDFFTDARAIALTKAKYRYIVARYAWCDHLMGWEQFNEIQNNPEIRDHMDTVISWHKAMADYIRSIDPYHHLITTSYTDPAQALERETNIDYDQGHVYTANPGDWFRTNAGIKSTRPIFWGEFGQNGSQTRSAIHDGIWSGLMAPFAGIPQFWYWDTVQHDNWWPEWSGLAAFASQSGLSSAKDTSLTSIKLEPSVRGTLKLFPGLGWETERGNGTVTISPDGAATGMRDIPSFIQGKSHPDMMPHPLTLNLNSRTSTTIHVNIAKISASGAHLKVSTDAAVSAELDLPGTGSDQSTTKVLDVPVSAGPHTIVIENTGPDWFVLDNVSIDNVAPGVIAISRSYGSRYAFWASRTSPAPSGAPVTATITLPNTTASHYVMTLWDTNQGHVAGAPMVYATHNGALTVTVTLVGQDIAGWLAPAQK